MKIANALMAVVLSAALPAAAARAQATPGLPTGDAVVEQYIDATGGKAAYETLTNRVSIGTLEVVGANLKGKLKLTQAAPGKLINDTDLGAAGKTSQGTDGRVAWEVSTFNGERILQGEEGDAFRSQALFNAEVRWRERFTKAECLGIEEVEGKPSYKVAFTPKVGKPVVEFYDVKTHLMTRQTSTTKTPMGEIKVNLYPGDYRKVDGILIPMTARQRLLSQEFVLTFTDIKHNVALPRDAFAPPKSILERATKKAK